MHLIPLLIHLSFTFHFLLSVTQVLLIYRCISISVFFYTFHFSVSLELSSFAEAKKTTVMKRKKKRWKLEEVGAPRLTEMRKATASSVTCIRIPPFAFPPSCLPIRPSPPYTSSSPLHTSLSLLSSFFPLSHLLSFYSFILLNFSTSHPLISHPPNPQSSYPSLLCLLSFTFSSFHIFIVSTSHLPNSLSPYPTPPSFHFSNLLMPSSFSLPIPLPLIFPPLPPPSPFYQPSSL